MEPADFKNLLGSFYTAVTFSDDSTRLANMKVWAEGVQAKHGEEGVELVSLVLAIHAGRAGEATLNEHRMAMQERKQYVWIAIVFFVLALITLGLLVWQLPRLRTYGLEAVTVAALSVLGVFVGVGTFGVLKSTGAVKGQRWGVAMEFGGAAAAMVFVVLAGLVFEFKMRPREFACSIYLCLADKPSEPLLVDGSVWIALDKREQYAISQGVAYPQRIAEKWAGQPAQIFVQVAGYELVDQAVTIILTPDERFYIKVRQLEH